MRYGPLFIICLILVGALFWPWLLFFAGFAAVVAIAGAITRGGRK